jgi:hypothetical protein
MAHQILPHIGPPIPIQPEFLVPLLESLVEQGLSRREAVEQFQNSTYHVIGAAPREQERPGAFQAAGEAAGEALRLDDVPGPSPETQQRIREAMHLPGADFSFLEPVVSTVATLGDVLFRGLEAGIKGITQLGGHAVEGAGLGFGLEAPAIARGMENAINIAAVAAPFGAVTTAARARTVARGAPPVPGFQAALQATPARFPFGGKSFNLEFASDFDRALYLADVAPAKGTKAGLYRVWLQDQGFTKKEIEAASANMAEQLSALAKGADPAAALNVPSTFLNLIRTAGISPVKGGMVGPNIRAAIRDLLPEAGAAEGMNNAIDLLEHIVASVPVRRFGEVMDKHKVSANEISLFLGRSPEYGQTMATSVARNQQRLRSRGLDPDLVQGEGIHYSAIRAIQRTERFSKVLLVSPLGVAFRNFLTAGTRFPINAGMDAIDIVLSRTLSPALARLQGKPAPTPTPVAAFGNDLRKLFGRSPVRNKKMVDEILTDQPAMVDKLYSNVFGEFNFTNRAAQLALTFNRFQEYIVRRAVVVSTLDSDLRRVHSRSLDRVVRDGDFDLITVEMIEKAIKRSLEQTFAFRYENRLAQGIRTIFALPGGSLFATFPNFIMNAIVYTYDVSPVAFSKLLSRQTRDAIAAGDTTALSAATMSVPLALAAWEIRNSDAAGDKWNEIKIPGTDMTVDVRPFPVISTNLFVMELLRKSREGTLHEVTNKELLNGVAGWRSRGIAATTAIEQIVAGLFDLGDPERMRQALGELAGEYAGRGTKPAVTVRDLGAAGARIAGDLLRESYFGVASTLDDFAEKESMIRDVQVGNPVVDPALANLPFLDQLVPELQSPTREAAPQRQSPGLREIPGILAVEERNPAEEAFIQHDFNPQEISARSGDRDIDSRFNEILGPIVENVVSWFVTQPAYTEAPIPVQSAALRWVMIEVREEARDMFDKQFPDLAIKRSIRAIPRRDRRALESVLGEDLLDLAMKRLKQAGVPLTPDR